MDINKEKDKLAKSKYGQAYNDLCWMRKETVDKLYNLRVNLKEYTESKEI